MFRYKKLVAALFVLFSRSIFGYGFGVHIKHLEKIIEGQFGTYYHQLIQEPKYKPYFLYGSMMPDMQYTASYKNVLNELYAKIRAFKKNGVQIFSGLTYEINTYDIPDYEHVFGFDTHHDKYGMKFAEYMLQQARVIDNPNYPNPGSNGDNNSDIYCMRLAFALGYYAHLSEDVVCHNFFVPRVTAASNLGDLEVIKSNQSFGNDPNAQMEGIIEALIDNNYGANDDVADIVYNEIWVATDQREPSISTPLKYTYGPNTTLYIPENGWPMVNPVLLYFRWCIQQWYNSNPFNLPVDYKEQDHPPLSATGLRELATVFRFVYRFYPSISGHSQNGLLGIHKVLALWVANHVELTTNASALGYAALVAIPMALAPVTGLIPIAATWFLELMLLPQLNIAYLPGLIAPGLSGTLGNSMANDIRSLMSIMLTDMAHADKIVADNPDKINHSEYQRLKASPLFTHPTTILGPLWNEYLGLGCKVWDEVGPEGGGGWYNNWSPWHSKSMTWSTRSSLNNLLPSLYSSEPDVAVYDARFVIGNNVVMGYQPFTSFQTNNSAQIVCEFYNTKDVEPKNLRLRVKKDNHVIDYTQDAEVQHIDFTVDQDPSTYNTVNRMEQQFTFPVSTNDLLTNYGYYFEVANQSDNRAVFTSSMEQYYSMPLLTQNYYRLYGTYTKWPYSLGIQGNLCSIPFAAPLGEGYPYNGTYLVNGCPSDNLMGTAGSHVQLHAIPDNPSSTFLQWSDGWPINPRDFVVNTQNSIQAQFKRLHCTDNSTAISNNNQRKIVRTSDGFLHFVYESMNNVWYEMSSDNGITWSIMNGGKALTTGEAKNPSIDYFAQGTPINCRVVIAFQQKDGDNSRIAIREFIQDNGTYSPVPANFSIDAYTDYSTNINPAISCNFFGHTVLVWVCRDANPLGYGNTMMATRLYRSSGYSLLSYENLPLPNSGQYSVNPSIGVDTHPSEAGDDGLYSVAWEEGTSTGNTSQIRFVQLVAQSVEPHFYIESSTYKVLSTSCYPKNTHPSVKNGECRVVWLSEDPNIGDSKTLVFRNPSNLTRYWSYGNSPESPTITQQLNGYFIGWSQPDGSGWTNYWLNNSLSGNSIFQIPNVHGRDMQLTNGGTRANTKAVVLTGSSAPYAFSTVPIWDAATSDVMVATGVSGTVNYAEEGGVSFLFELGDVTNDGDPVSFVEADPDFYINTEADMNEYLTTVPFSVNNSSEFFYSVSYSCSNPEVAALVFANGGGLLFRVELVDESTSEILAVYDSVFYSATNTGEHDNFSYQVNCQGIGARTVRLRLQIHGYAVPDGEMMLGQMMSPIGGDILGKAKSLGRAEQIKFWKENGVVTRKSSKERTITFRGEMIETGKETAVITEYSLGQNYPNPFNPVTAISYALPKEGMVTLKVYDILGKGAAVLVSEEKPAGAYTVSFNALSLPSGTYFYELRAGDFRKVRKMMLVK